MNLRARIVEALPKLGSAETRVAEGVLADPAAFVGMDVAAVAARCRTSRSTVSRFCQSIGSGSFARFRVELAAEEARRTASAAPDVQGRILGDISPEDDAEQVVRKLADADLRAVTRVTEVVDYPAVAILAERLRGAARVLVFGAGSSTTVVDDLCFKLNVAGIAAVATADVHAALMIAAGFGAADSALIVSQSGRTRQALQVADAAAEVDAAVLVLTGDSRSPLAKLASCTVATAVEEPRVRSGGTASRLAMLVVVDLVFGLLMHGRGEDGVRATRLMRDATTSEKFEDNTSDA